jgi:arabinose-5-phosphate isomerase
MQFSIKQTAQKTIQLQAQSIEAMASYINDDFENAVHQINLIKGRVIISGIGKSGIVAQKIVSTLNSTGTPSLFMHAADAIHGDLGMVQQDDIVIVISKSGESAEIKVLVPLIKNFGNTLIAITGNLSGFLAKNANIVINCTVSKEACPNNLAPTTSTTAQMVMGDALAVALMELKGFASRDFAKYHPGGNLGKRLYLRVDDLFEKAHPPKVLANAPLREIIVEISTKRLGATAVITKTNEVLGIITDGDLRRMMDKETFFTDKLVAQDILTKNPKQISNEVLAIDALEEMRKNDISQLIVSNNNQYLGILHLHDLVREGLV